MLHSIKSLYGKRLAATDDKVGYIEDCYFDEKSWVGRYIVADTDWWSYPRRLLLSPHAFGPITDGGRTLPVNLTREQIENGPTLDWLGLVTRKFEDDYFQYYGWTPYWDGGFLWGPTDIPLHKSEHDKTPECAATNSQQGAKTEDKCRGLLRSVRGIFGFRVCSDSQTDGRLTDFLFDEKNWHLAYLVLDTGKWFSHREVLISTRKIASIDWDAGRVNVTPDKAQIDKVASRPVLHGKAAAFQLALLHT